MLHSLSYPKPELEWILLKTWIFESKNHETNNHATAQMQWKVSFEHWLKSNACFWIVEENQASLKLIFEHVHLIGKRF